jgi:hypothetical protein
MTAGKLVSQCRTHHLGVHVLEQAEQRENERLSQKAEKYKRDEFIYLKNCAKADAAIAANKDRPDNVEKWKRDHILDLIRPWKQPGDKAMPINKPELYQRYLETRHRQRRPVDECIKKDYNEALLVLDEDSVDDDISIDSALKQEETPNERLPTSL